MSQTLIPLATDRQRDMEAREVRPAHAAGTRDEAAPSSAAFDTYTGYCGPYVVNEAEHYVVHTLEEAAYPNWSRSLQKRFLELKDGNMTMKTPLILIDGNQTVGVLVWEKVH